LAGLRQRDLSVRSLQAVGLNGSSRWIHFCYRLAQAARECAEIYEEFRPDAVLGMGGFTSAPAVLAAKWRRSPTVIHESNAVPGKANRWVGPWVDHVAVGLADCARFFGRQPVTVTGTPVRAGLRRVADAHARLGLARDKLTVVVMGGSQGAQAINEAMACTLPWLEEWTERVQFVHLSGGRDEAFMREVYEKNGMPARVMGFCQSMEDVYSVADVVVARAGAATLAEIAAFGVPAILVPYPHAAGNHQWHNARQFERAGAARLLEQTALMTGLHAARGERLGDALVALLGDETTRQRMAAAARGLAHGDAAARLAGLVEQLGNGRGTN
jgi:UDP-N-acetylglucosamine--N-acetylmuramyl-(pentapeptide) pyrophosphoryl-undecaprenol N-acetylglucosamine transferase